MRRIAKDALPASKNAPAAATTSDNDSKCRDPVKVSVLRSLSVGGVIQMLALADRKVAGSPSSYLDTFREL